MKSSMMNDCGPGVGSRGVSGDWERTSGAARRWVVAVFGLVAGGVLAGIAAESPLITTQSLLKDMTDLTGLASFPQPAYTVKQFSSYDRASKSPAVEWFANGDAGHYLRVEDRQGRKEHVMMDAEGPGAVVRIWSANPAGTLRIYLDGSDAPALEAPMTDLLGGTFPGLPKPIAGEYSKGWNLYFPIPYARHCKITSDKGGFYYHVNYRTYPAGTRVQSFERSQIESLRAPIQAVLGRLSDPRGKETDFAGAGQWFDMALPAGETLRQEFYGPAAFTRVALRVSAANPEAALRGLIARIAFDGEACVETPLGDLFGTAPGVNAYSALPLGVTREGEFYCHWYMPFKEYATIELVNHTREEVGLRGEINVADAAWTDASMHFHAKWRAQFDVPTRPMIDWNYLTARGKGVFVGVAFAIDNPVKDWWGEGDEKIYVDGETFPSHFGTGTEDYYGYAWCWPGLFTHAYHAQPRCDGPGNYGRTSVNRFHVLDRIPFTKDFRFDMELWHWHQQCKVNMAVTAYWYARPGASDGFKAIQPQEAVVRPMTPYTAPKVAGAIEGETLKILKVTGVADPQEWAGLSGERHLWWHEGMEPGDTLVVAFPAPKAGKYRVRGHFLQARDYGIHQLAVAGQKAGEPRDFYNPDVKPTAEIDLGVFDLKAGDNEFSVTVIGANPKAQPSYMFGLDYLKLQPVD
ncbi:MAG TPA: DUF2961 domain-containing protein [Verrucomicrobiota bacterium]|nr:DUF2961 domain-containing protein [Verrucomicrobiota bacterium]HNU51381.1 DUF2961 domain-containing protein [Verrucomicrobiota bacterium]